MMTNYETEELEGFKRILTQTTGNQKDEESETNREYMINKEQ